MASSSTFCWKCKKTGHLKRDCPEGRKQEESKEQIIAEMKKLLAQEEGDFKEEKRVMMCWIRKQEGHYASQCHEKKTKKLKPKREAFEIPRSATVKISRSEKAKEVTPERSTPRKEETGRNEQAKGKSLESSTLKNTSKESIQIQSAPSPYDRISKVELFEKGYLIHSPLKVNLVDIVELTLSEEDKHLLELLFAGLMNDYYGNKESYHEAFAAGLGLGSKNLSLDLENLK
ncbi:hypothetical protein ACLOJK_001156 [Asimina triloba]